MNYDLHLLMKRRLFPLLLFLTCACFLPAGEEEDLVVRRLTSADGLSQDSVTCVLQDKEGFIWFGTADGLNRYDGYGFTIFKHHDNDPDSLSGSFIHTLFLDNLGRLWVGTNAGLDLFERDSMRFLHAEKYWQLPPGSLSGKVFALQQGQDGTYWICFLNLVKAVRVGRDAESSKPKGELVEIPYPGTPATLNTIVLDQSDHLWAGGRGGLVRLRDGRWQSIPLKNEKTIDVHSLYADGANRLWVGSNQGLWRLDIKASGEIDVRNIRPGGESGLSSAHVKPIIRDHRGSLWICTRRGLNRLENENDPAASPRFRSLFHDETNIQTIGHNDIWGICEDRSGIIWIATYGGGAAKVIRNKKAFLCYSTYPETIPGLKGQSVMALYEDRQGMIWAGTEAGANCLDRRSGQFVFYPFDSEKSTNLQVKCFQEDNLGALWLGTTRGLYRVNRENRILAPLSVSVPLAKEVSVTLGTYTRCLYRDRQGLIWAGTRGRGVLTIDTSRQAYTPFLSAAGEALTNTFVYCFLEDSSNRMWIGTNKSGLARVDAPHGRAPQARFYKNLVGNPDSISSNSVLSLCEYPAGILWIGTADGLNRLEVSTGKFQRYSEKEGLPNANIYSILPDNQGNLWMSTNRGISCFNPARTTFKNFLLEDGLQNNEFNGGAYCRCRDGLLVFGGINGFNTILPGDRQEAPTIPPIHLTDFRLLRRTAASANDSDLFKEIISRGSLRLSYRENSFSLDFSALDYMNPAKNEYSYILEGFDRNWIYAGNRRYASYTSLAAGSYVFRIRGASSQGIWNDKGFSFAITIFPPFWRTPWFVALVAMLCFASLYGGHRLRLNIVEHRARQLETFNRELQEQMIQRRVVEEALKKSEEKYRTLTGNINAGIFRTDPHDRGRFIEVNPAMVRILGFDSREELLETDVAEIYDNPAERDSVVESLKTYGAIQDREIRLRRKDGTPIWCRFSAVAVRGGEQGEVICHDGLIEDVSEKKKLESELLQIQKLEAIGQLAGGMAHDFNNILTVVIGQGELVRQSLDSGHPLAKNLDAILTSGKHGRDLIAQLLAFSRRQIVEPRLLDVNREIQGLESILRRLLPEDITIQVVLSPGLPPIKADPAQIEAIFINLVLNARDAISKAHLSDPNTDKLISIETAEIFLDQRYVEQHPGSVVGSHVMIAISDTGSGMTEQVRQKIFEPFFTTKPREKGTGLGLPSVFGMVKQNNGSIYVYSEPGQGSTIKIYWPAMQSGDVVEPAQPVPHWIPPGDETILVVEDDPAVREFIRMALESFGYRVIEAGDGKEALKLLQDAAGAVRMILSDVVMPKMSGKELSRRAQECSPELRVLFTSGYTDNHILHDGKLDEGVHFIQKPFTLQALARKVREVLDASGKP